MTNQAEQTRRMLELALLDLELAHLHPRIEQSGSGAITLLLESGIIPITLPVKWVPYPGRIRLEPPGVEGQLHGLLLSPRIAAPLAKDLRRWGFNHADLEGRLFIKEEGLLVDREPRRTLDKQVAASLGLQREPDLFSAKSARIARSFLGRPGREWTQEALVRDTQCSRGYISRTLGAYESQQYIVRTGKGNRLGAAGYALRDAGRLLEDWASRDKFTRRVDVFQYSVLENDMVKLADSLLEALASSRFALTQWIAAWLRRPFTTPPLVSAYVDSSDAWRFPLGRRVDQGGNIRLLVPRDEGVYQGLQYVGQLPLVCDAQIYLDLVGEGQRGPEAALELRNWEGFGHVET